MEIFAIIFLGIALYCRTIDFSLIVDDVAWYRHIQKNPGYFNNIPTFLKCLKDRLYGGATFWSYKLHKDTIKNEQINIGIDHGITSSLQILSCILIYTAFGSSQVSFWAATLYLCNAINNQTSVWLNGRRYLINIILALSMIIIGKWGIVFYPLMCLFQVNAIFSPILLFNQSPWFILAIPLAVAFGYKKIKAMVNSRVERIPDDDRKIFTPKRLIIITKFYGHYFFKMIIPGWCGFIYPTLHYWGRTEEGNKDAYSFNMDFLRGIGAFFVSGVFCFVLPVEYKPFLAFMVFSTLQWCAIIPVVGDLSDRYVSLANVFMMLFVSYLISTYLGPNAVPALAGLSVYYASELFKVMKMYQDFPSYWEYHRFYSPNIPMPRNTEAKFYLNKMNPIKAWVLVEEGLRYTPNDYNMLQIAALCHKAIGEYGAARMFTEKAQANYYLYQKESQEPQLKEFLDSLIPPSGSIQGQPSRQVLRAEARKNAKK